MSSSTPPPPPDGASQPYPSAPHDPWAHHPPAEDHAHGGGEGVGAPKGTGSSGSGSGSGSDVRELLVVALAVALAGVVLGLLWWWLADPVPYISDGERAFLRYSEGEETVGADAVFVLLAAGLGALSGLLVFLVRRLGGISVVIGLALGSVLAGVVGWQLGELLGPGGDLAARAAEAGRGEMFDGPLRLNGTVGLLVWPLLALLVHLILTALFGPRDPEPEPELAEHAGWGPPPAGPEPAGLAPEASSGAPGAYGPGESDEPGAREGQPDDRWPGANRPDDRQP